MAVEDAAMSEATRESMPPAKRERETLALLANEIKSSKERERETDAMMTEQFKTLVAALEAASKRQNRIIIGLVIVLAMLVAGIVGVGVTGNVPGVGEITIEQPKPAAPTPAP